MTASIADSAHIPVLSVKVDRITSLPERGHQMYRGRRGSKVANPVVTAMLKNNNLSDCGQVKDLLHHCRENDSNAVICETAARYFESCYTETA